jgi:hypothetical protein
MHGKIEIEPLLNLIDEAIEQIAHLEANCGAELESVFREAKNVLETQADSGYNLKLVLAAARLRIQQAEQKTIAYMVTDTSEIGGVRLPSLVRLRQICARLLHFITDLLEDLRPAQKKAWFSI